MATTNARAHCSICNDEEDTYECKGCLTIYCFHHLTDHREIINQQLNKIEDNRNLFRQIINDQKNDPEQRSLIKQINQWKEDSIKKIKQIAERYKRRLIHYTDIFIIEIENRLDKITDEIKEIRQKNKFNEIKLQQLKENLNKLKEELDKPSDVSIEQEPSLFINKISVIIPLDKSKKIIFFSSFKQFLLLTFRYQMETKWNHYCWRKW
jgi:hypothetical protein